MKRGALHLGLFLATGASVLVTAWATLSDDWWDAAFFTVGVLLIVGAHEMGHYLMARAHRVEATLPYFIPLPLLGFGTLGAVIRLKGRVPDRNALVDIGAAGPLAGMAVAAPLLVAGVRLSHVAALPAGAQVPGFPGPMSLWGLGHWVAQYARHALTGTPAPPDCGTLSLYGDNLLSMGVVRALYGPLPPGHDVYAHPLFLAAWFGMLVTMLNLMPVGQLDGGHLTFAWFGRRAEGIGRVLAGTFLVLALFFSLSWLVWFFLTTRLVGLGHPPVVHDAVPLSFGRKAICVVSFAVAVVTFMPVPLGVL